MTDRPQLDADRTLDRDADRAARLARLRERRGDARSSSAGTASDMTKELSFPPPASESVPERIDPSFPSPSTPPAGPTDDRASAATRRSDRPHRGRPRRRSVATNAKIITVGASTTAVLGMVAGYGIADGMAAEATDASTAPPVSSPASIPAMPATIPPASPSATPTTAPPQVIVVFVDAQTGRPISTASGSGTGVLDAALGELSEPAPATGSTTPAGAPATVPATTTASPALVEAPAAVDLAVPAVPQPRPQAAPAAQAAPQPAPQPQATSSGS